MKTQAQVATRYSEAFLLAMVSVAAILGFALLAVGSQVHQGGTPWAGLPSALLPPLVMIGGSAGLHILMSRRRMQVDQIILPLSLMIFTTGLLMIWRLQGAGGAWQQLLRGYLPGIAVIAVLIVKPHWVERMRRLAVPICLLGLILLVATAFLGVIDESGSRLALQFGSLPPVQPSEVIKLTLIVFLAWYIDRQGKQAEGRAQPFLGWLRLPALHYFVPGLLFTAITTLALVKMSDFGAVLIVTFIFVGMLFSGFEPRVFGAISAIGLALISIVALILSFSWRVPTVIRYRFLAFQNPWSNEVILLQGKSTGVTISDGPGYQIQQALDAVVSGGIGGAGLGFGTPQYVPLAHSDFIFAAIVEELGSMIALAILFLFAILLIRMARIAIMLPGEQVFERLLIVGICIHFFVQVFIMVGGTLNLLPVTGVTIPLLSQGGMALLINLTEIGLVLSLSQRLEVQSG